MAENKIKVMVVGCGNMGSSHAKAYSSIEGFNLIGLVDKRAAVRDKLAADLGGDIIGFSDYSEALEKLKPDAVAVCTYPNTHAELTIKALNAGAHVFVEKPIAETVEAAREIVATSKKLNKKIVVGYILRHHPAWQKFIEISHTLGKPLVMRMNLNQQSSCCEWETHKNLLKSMSPIVDCGVHYVDIMCQMTRAKPIRVTGMGAHLTDEIKKDMYNYGHLQVCFDDGSVGWYEAGWGPMMSEIAYFVKDVIGPKGCVSIVEPKDKTEGSSNIDSHTKTNCLQVHSSETDNEGKFIKEDVFINTSDEPDHNELCKREQQYFLRTIKENLDLTDHLEDAINSLRIVLAADLSVRQKKSIEL